MLRRTHLLRSSRLAGFLLLSSLLVMLLAGGLPAAAVDVPVVGGVAFIQTSGPNVGLNVGDYYTNANGEPTPADREHRLEIAIPCDWPPATPITFALFDPEVALPNPASPTALDEISGANDTTTFTLRAPGGAVVGPVNFAAADGTNGLWVELVTVAPATAGYGCGTYLLTSTASDDDENGWRLRVGNDPDCVAGACSGIGAVQSGLLDNGNQTSDPDGLPGTGDELEIGHSRLSYQHASNGCQDFYYFVDGLTSPAAFNNFDLDDFGGGNAAISVTYNSPSGAVIAGTESGNTSWNGSPNNGGNNPNPPRTGDSVPIGAADVGWWRAVVCVNANNQYIFEGIEGEPVFFQQPLFPEMTLDKDNGVDVVAAAGEPVTYTLSYANIGTGAAVDTTITDTLPPGATFVSCSDGCTGTGPVTWDLGTVPAAPNAGSSGSVTLTVQLPPLGAGETHVNNATLDFTDTLGNVYPDLTAIDTDTVVGTSPTATPLPPVTTPAPPTAQNPPTLTKSVTPAFALPGESVTWTLVIGNPGGGTITNLSLIDTLPAFIVPQGVESSAGSAASSSIEGQQVRFTLASLAPGGSVTVTVRSRISTDAAPPYVLTNNACLTSDQNSTPICTQASVISAAELPATGDSPWSAWRGPLFGLLMLLGALLLIRGLPVYRRWQALR